MDNYFPDKWGTCKTVERDIEEVRGSEPTPDTAEDDPLAVLTQRLLG